MKKASLSRLVASCLVGSAAGARAEPALTIYNQDFAVVRDVIDLDLKAGVNQVRYADTTAHLEPDSVILRDPAGKHALQILEQNYRADPVTQELLLSLYEGREIDFQVQQGEKVELVRGKIVRSGYVPHVGAMSRYGQEYAAQQYAMWGSRESGGGQPVIEVDGKLRFSLPGIPLFPALTDDTILKPTLHWVIETNTAGKLAAELAYITGGMSWEADYNVTAPEASDKVDLVGWVTIDNQCGKTFKDARIKLMAGDVMKVKQQARRGGYGGGLGGFNEASEPPVTEKAFDEYHLYTLHRASTLRDRESKQVEFVRASGVAAGHVYVYDGAQIDYQRYGNWGEDDIRDRREYGTKCDPKVRVMREFRNSQENYLGIPLPRGRVRFYRRDESQLEFVGENVIDHTPKDETVRVYTGNAFDLVGERHRTYYKIDADSDWLDEAFEIKLRNHKKDTAEIRVVEHLYRWVNWELVSKSDDYRQLDARTIEFRVTVPPDGERLITYKAHYSW